MRNSAIAAAMLAGAAVAYTDIRFTRFMVKNIDPIVFPGAYRSHMHSFFGSDVVTKDLPTTKQLQSGCTTGQNPNDMSVYCELHWTLFLYGLTEHSRGPDSLLHPRKRLPD
jgi:hypothetical protein